MEPTTKPKPRIPKRTTRKPKKNREQITPEEKQKQQQQKTDAHHKNQLLQRLKLEYEYSQKHNKKSPFQRNTETGIEDVPYTELQTLTTGELYQILDTYIDFHNTNKKEY